MTFKILKKIFLVVIATLSIIFLILDSKLVVYGENRCSYASPLPFGITPEKRLDFEGGFILWDKHDMSLIGKGVQYWESDIVVEEIISYGFNKDILISQIIDVNNDIYFVEVERKNKRLKVKIKSHLDKEKLNNLRWINIKEKTKEYYRIQKLTSYIFILINPLCILNDINFNIIDVSIKNKFIDILNGC